MSNYCWTNITFYGDKKNIIKDFHDTLIDWLNSPTLAPEAWGGKAKWLGNILIHAGYEHKAIAGGHLPFSYRGQIDEISDLYKTDSNIYSFSIETETAWTQMIIMWEEIIARLYPNQIKIAYLADEPEDEGYYKYDPDNLFYKSTYLIDTSIENTETIKKAFPYLKLDVSPDRYTDCIACTTDEAIRFMQEVTNSTETDEDKLLEAAEIFNKNLRDIDENSFFHIFKYEIARNEEIK